LPLGAWKRQYLRGDACPVRQWRAQGRRFRPEGAHRRGSSRQGLDRLTNGDLLKAAELTGFDVLVTTDRNIRHQQNLSTRTIAIVVLGKGSWPLIRARPAYARKQERRLTMCWLAEPKLVQDGPSPRRSASARQPSLAFMSEGW
jgi:hypothetical protein